MVGEDNGFNLFVNHRFRTLAIRLDHLDHGISLEWLPGKTQWFLPVSILKISFAIIGISVGLTLTGLKQDSGAWVIVHHVWLGLCLPPRCVI